MKLLITGHSGFIGQHLAQKFAEGNELYFLENDLLNYDAVRNEVISANPDIIIHLAARTEVEKSFYEQITFSEVNYVGTVNLIEAAREASNLKNFVFASTVEVYGWQPISDLIKNGTETEIPCFDEETVANPNAPYAVAKYACEKYLEYAHRSYDFPYTIIRQTNAYGRKDNDFFVTEQIIMQMLKNSDEINLGYDKPFRSFIYIDDLMGAWETVIRNPDKCVGQLFCLGPNDPIRISDYVDLIAKKIGWSGKVNWDTKPARPGEIYLLNTSNEKITRMTGWEPKVSLSDGLDRTIEFWKTHLNV